MKRLLLAAVLTTVTVANGLPVRAADKPADSPAQGKKELRGKFRPFNGKIKAVDKTAKTITLEGDKAQTFQITSETRIRKDSKPATLEEIAAGDHVVGRAKETVDGKWDAVTVNVGRPAAKVEKPKADDKK